jgi:dienelactone hydrolase
VRRLAFATLTAAFSFTSIAVADELVKFDSASYRVGLLQQRLARERGETPKELPGTPIEGYLTKPEGPGPFPAVVMLHGCEGWAEASRQERSAWFTNLGYVALAVDSFATRGIKEACDQDMPERQADAWGALFYLSKIDFVDPQRVAVVGWSQGGIVALEIASARPFKAFNIPDDLEFKAVVAFYPLCRVAADQMSMPTLVLIGELDDWTPATDCERWVGRNAGKDAPIKLVIYPGAFHAFDASSLGEGKRSFGHWLKYDPDADERSKTEMRNFLAVQLGAR